jgi:hypothetical protein
MTLSSHSSIIKVEMYNIANKSWPRILIGGVATVAGIFLILEINAWRHDRQVSFEEQQVLQNLKEEYTTLHKVLKQHLAEHLRTLEFLENLLLAIENGSSKDAGPTIDSALLEMTSLVTWDRSEIALEALLSSGRTEFLTNGKLRARLSAWEGVFGEFLDDQEIANKMVYETHIPYFVRKNVAVAAVMTESSDNRPTPERSISDDPDAIRQLLEDPKFHVLAEVRYRFKEHLIVEIEIAIAAAEAILAEVEEPPN